MINMKRKQINNNWNRKKLRCAKKININTTLCFFLLAFFRAGDCHPNWTMRWVCVFYAGELSRWVTCASTTCHALLAFCRARPASHDRKSMAPAATQKSARRPIGLHECPALAVVHLHYTFQRAQEMHFWRAACLAWIDIICNQTAIRGNTLSPALCEKIDWGFFLWQQQYILLQGWNDSRKLGEGDAADYDKCAQLTYKLIMTCILVVRSWSRRQFTASHCQGDIHVLLRLL